MTDLDYSYSYYTGDYMLMYHSMIPKEWCTPLMSLDKLLSYVNKEVLTKPKKEHHNGDTNALARIIRLNWLVDNLQKEPMLKPIVLLNKFSNWYEPNKNDVWEVITGDTRLQALELLSQIKHVSAIIQIPVFHRNYYLHHDWRDITKVETLMQYLGIYKKHQIICNENWILEPIKWIEFSMPEANFHMHDEDQRLRMAYNYLDKQSRDFLFTREWFQRPIDWNKWDNLDGH